MMTRWPRAWPRIRQALWIALAVAVLGLIGWRAREIEWSEVLTALRAMPLPTVAQGALIAVAAHAAYISYDLLARRYTGHRLGIGRTAAVAGVCFAFNLNLGALVGGVALRYRLYGRFGLTASMITRILGFSLLTNWIGYSALAGAAFCQRAGRSARWRSHFERCAARIRRGVAAASRRVFGGVSMVAAAPLECTRPHDRAAAGTDGGAADHRIRDTLVAGGVSTVRAAAGQSRFRNGTRRAAAEQRSRRDHTHSRRARCAGGRVSVVIGRRASNQSTACGVACVPSSVLSGAIDSRRVHLRCARICCAPPPCAHLRAIGCEATFGDDPTLTAAFSALIYDVNRTCNVR